MYKKILVPLDGSHLSETVLPHVRDLAKTTGAQVILLRIVVSTVPEVLYTTPPLMPVQPVSRVPERELFDQAEGYLQRVAFDYFPDQSVQLQVSGGPTEDSILDAAAAERVDLIAMSTHGRGGVARLVLGSVADQIVRRSHLPVLLVRPQEA